MRGPSVLGFVDEFGGDARVLGGPGFELEVNDVALPVAPTAGIVTVKLTVLVVAERVFALSLVSTVWVVVVAVAP